MTTILFVSEGPTDIGPSFERGRLEMDSTQGVICGLVKKIIAQETGNYPGDLHENSVPVARLHGKGLDKKVLYAMQQIADKHSEYHDCAAIVFVVDQDNQPQRIESLRTSKEKAKNLAQLRRVRIAVGMAIVKLEAWLLADAKALRNGLGNDRIQQPPLPENISDPKEYIRGQFRADDSRSTLEKFMAIVEQIDSVKPIATRCPKGFAPFYDEVKNEIVDLFR